MDYTSQFLNDVLSALIIGLPIICIMAVAYLSWHNTDFPNPKKRGK